MMEEMKGGGGMKCPCPHHGVFPALVILFGLLFLGGNLSWWGMGLVDLGWPILVILAGLMKLSSRMCKCC